jgi:hypothetical protein
MPPHASCGSRNSDFGHAFFFQGEVDKVAILFIFSSDSAQALH